uniref:Cadherin domain-containing protein n=1 Tax=Leptobrachium leishanense TaxID=445787 RepID=A0A8C5PUM3_9ANUR
MDRTGRDLLSLLILVLCLDLTLLYGHADGWHKTRGKRSRDETLKRAKRTWIIDSFQLEEELPDPYPKFIGRVQVEEDEQIKYELTGKGVDEDPKGLFHINEEDGSIYVHQKIDYEVTPMFQWKFSAINKTSLKVGTKLGIHLKILDINDNTPTFSYKSYEASVNESLLQGNIAYKVLAKDIDEEHSLNSKVDYRIVSQTPTDSEVEFTINKETGLISFKGCLDYERNKKYKLLIEAKDNGAKFQLSSSCEVVLNVIDRNNHLPVWVASTLKSSVPEREANVTILRFGVTDVDTVHTSAWRAVYSIISGNDDGNYAISTDPKTNEGILRVIKPLDYEETPQSILSVMVENEEPFFSCKVLQRPKTDGLWQLETAKANGGTMAQQTRSVVVDIEDANDPPIFIPDKITISTEEHSMEANTVLGKVEAKDMDIVNPNKIKYRIRNDSADWLSINEDTGVVTAKCQMDRESEYVINSKYIVEVLAIDDGKPSMTGTATLYINLKDINDNAPRLESPFMTTCYSKEEVIISAMVKDKDLDPYSGPFHFDVLDKDRETKTLKLLNKNGDSIQIMKVKDAAPGNHTMHLEIYDRQGVTSFQNLTVYVCDCLTGDACVMQMKMTGPPALGGGAIILLLLAMLLFLGLGLFLCKFHNKKDMIPVETEPLNSMIVYNEEGGNRDCLESSILNAHMVGSALNSQETKDGVDAAFARLGTQRSLETKDGVDAAFARLGTRRSSAAEEALQGKSRVRRSHSVQGASTHHAFDRVSGRRHSSYHRERRMNTLYRAALHQNSTNVGHRRSSRYATNSLSRKNSRTVEAVLSQRLEAHAANWETYKPRAFAEEGDLSKSCSLESITIAGSTAHMASLENLGSKFNILEDICLDFISSRSMEEPSMMAENMDGINNALS